MPASHTRSSTFFSVMASMGVFLCDIAAPFVFYFPKLQSFHLDIAVVQCATAVKNLLFWLRLAASCDVNVEHRLLNAVM